MGKSKQQLSGAESWAATSQMEKRNKYVDNSKLTKECILQY